MLLHILQLLFDGSYRFLPLHQQLIPVFMLQLMSNQKIWTLASFEGLLALQKLQVQQAKQMMNMKGKRLMIYLRSSLDIETKSKYSASQCSVSFDGLLHNCKIVFKQSSEILPKVRIAVQAPLQQFLMLLKSG